MTRPRATLSPEFMAGLEGKSDDWKARAIAGLVTREGFGVVPHRRAWAREHGLSRAMTADEREAWLYGFDFLERQN